MTLEADLALIGYRVGASAEHCACALCRLLDLQHDVDALAADAAGRLTLVSHRGQDDYDLRTITIRWKNDNGNADSQLAKLLDGRSWAHIYVQGYPSGVAWIDSARLAEALQSQRTKHCSAHKASLLGSDGQRFVVACGKCADVAYVPRSTGIPEWDDASYARLPF